MNRNLSFQDDPASGVMQRLSELVRQLEQKNMLLEEALQHNFRIFDALLRNGEQGITLTGPDRRIVRVIKGLTGIEPTTLSGVLIDSLAVPEDRQSIVDAYHQLTRTFRKSFGIIQRITSSEVSPNW